MCVSHQEFRNGFNGSNRSQCIDPVHHKKQVQECFWRGPHHLLFHNVHWMSKALAKRTRKTRLAYGLAKGGQTADSQVDSQVHASHKKSYISRKMTCDQFVSTCLLIWARPKSTQVGGLTKRKLNVSRKLASTSVRIRHILEMFFWGVWNFTNSYRNSLKISPTILQQSLSGTSLRTSFFRHGTDGLSGWHVRFTHNS